MSTENLTPTEVAGEDSPAMSIFERYLTVVSYTHLRAHETQAHIACRLLLEQKTNHIILWSTSCL